jgi:RHS repeat-associated protein
MRSRVGYLASSWGNHQPTIEQFKATSSAGSLQAYVLTDPKTGQPTMLATSSDQDCLYVLDGIGQPVGLLTSFSSNAFPYSYDPYGVPRLTGGGTGQGTSQNPYLFKAGLQDRATGLVKFGQRWYNPTTGTWTQQDTLDTPLDPANANRYAFVAGDPINRSDPSGLCSWEEGLGVISAGAGVGTALGAGVGAVAGFFVGGAGPGAVAGGVVGALAGADAAGIAYLVTDC